MQEVVVKEFSRFAHAYDDYSVIQKEVAETLVSHLLDKHYSNIIDVGCGSGAVFKNILEKEISFSKFVAVDASLEMLDLHPSEPKVKKLCANFNLQKTFHLFTTHEENVLLSSSALQWSKDLDFTLSRLAKKAPRAYFAIFTANTFSTMHKSSGVKSPIYSPEQLQESIQKYYKASFELQRYTLHFSSTQEMFRYIKKSGVSGGEKQLSYKETRHLMETYPLDYLEFEVLFVKAKALTHTFY
jgi:malonyl-CoA O-methyltransferase